MQSPDTTVLVIGATGAQGGTTARALLEAGHRVRVLVRAPCAPASRALARAGAAVMTGDLDDPISVDAAMIGAYAVFSVQVPDTTGQDSERRHGFTLVRAARSAGVQHFVHTSVCEAGRHTGFPQWGSNRWYQKYWTDKWDIEELVREAGFPLWTVLKPAFMMDNFAQPKARFMFPHLRQGRIVGALRPSTRLQLIAAEDVGAFARTAIEQPARFNRQNIDLAAEALTMGEVATVLTTVLGHPVRAESVSPEQALAAGLHAGWVRSQEWTNEVGYRADLGAAKSHGIVLTSFARWVERHRDAILIEP